MENRRNTCPESSDFDENLCGGRCFARRVFLAGSQLDLAAKKDFPLFFIAILILLFFEVPRVAKCFSFEGLIS